MKCRSCGHAIVVRAVSPAEASRATAPRPPTAVEGPAPRKAEAPTPPPAAERPRLAAVGDASPAPVAQARQAVEAPAHRAPDLSARSSAAPALAPVIELPWSDRPDAPGHVGVEEPPPRPAPAPRLRATTAPPSRPSLRMQPVLPAAHGPEPLPPATLVEPPHHHKERAGRHGSLRSVLILAGLLVAAVLLLASLAGTGSPARRAPAPASTAEAPAATPADEPTPRPGVAATTALDAPRELASGDHAPLLGDEGCPARALRLPPDLAALPTAPVTVRLAVGPTGQVSHVRPQGEFADPRLAEAIRAAVAGCEWKPGTDAAGRPAWLRVERSIRFR